MEYQNRQPQKTGLKVIIGRSSQCDFTIENPDQHGTVSGKHATLYQTEDPTLFIFEDHSTNGSYVNGLLIHNAESVVSIQHHITLGKSYELPIADICHRYFTGSRTTELRKRRGVYVSPEPIVEPINSGSTGTNGVSISSADSIDTRPFGAGSRPIEGPVGNQVPVWYWIISALLIGAAFIIGTLI